MMRWNPLQDAKPNGPVRIRKVIYGFILSRESRGVFMNYCGFSSIIFLPDYQRFILHLLATRNDSGMNIKWEVMDLNWAVDVAVYHKRICAKTELFAHAPECCKFFLSCLTSFAVFALAINLIYDILIVFPVSLSLHMLLWSRRLLLSWNMRRWSCN